MTSAVVDPVSVRTGSDIPVIAKPVAAQLNTAEKVAKIFIIFVIMAVAGAVGAALTAVLTAAFAHVMGPAAPFVAAAIAGGISFTPAILAVNEVSKYFENRAIARITSADLAV
jgi:hypothetical protein